MSPTVSETQRILEGLVSLMSPRLEQVDLEDYYKVIDELGTGTFGSVLMAKDKATDKTMALKFVKKSRASLQSFLTEHYTSFFLSSHQSIIGSYGVAFQTMDHYVFSQEWSPFGDLFGMIEDRVGIPEVKAKRCAVQIASALDFMGSKGLVHRDIKPENILLFDEECHCVKVSDFGLTCLKGTLIQARSGTASYMSPELCRPSEGDTLHADSSLDAWAFGVLLFCALSGYFPWEEAVPENEDYKAFVYWANTGPVELPSLWTGFATGALDLLKRLFAFNPVDRVHFSDVLPYVNLPWKSDAHATRGREGDQETDLELSYECVGNDSMTSFNDCTQNDDSHSGHIRQASSGFSSLLFHGDDEQSTRSARSVVSFSAMHWSSDPEICYT
ncbi:serine/threonine-protein kinase SBK1-like [Ambystoma mexicanum]|uniref:serine/threonine-protein kinase SBK1-like n=1 Tax=Ambystoma mexicanum TaxID=8296 RepID=UPI0037E75C16